MPVVTSLTIFAEQSAHYRGEESSTCASQKPGNDVMETVIAICNQVLSSEPQLVARLAAGKASRAALISAVSQVIGDQNMRANVRHTGLLRQVEDFLFGYGPLQPFINDESISDIDGTGPDEFTITRHGRREAIDLVFPSEKVYDTFCRLLIIRNGGVINENDSHCRVADPRHRLRINVTVPPRSVRTATISIRKHRRLTLNLQDLLDQGMLNSRTRQILRDLAGTDASVVFCGKGAAGKTTLLKAFIQAMPPLERVLIAESDSEIYPEKPCCLVQKIKKQNEGGRPVDLRELISDGLTLSLDTYCIGEIVGPEAYEFIRAAFSGHRCLATVHAHSAADALERLLSLARPAAAGESEKLMRKMLSQGINYVVHLSCYRITRIIKVSGLDERGEGFALENIWSKEENTPTDITADKSAVALVPDT